MFETFIKFSGIFATLVAWGLLVVPAVRSGMKVRSETITTAADSNHVVRFFVDFGLILGSILQALFLLFVIKTYHIGIFSVGSLGYLSTNLTTVLLTFFPHSKHTTVHNILTRYYFIANPIFLLLIGADLNTNNTLPLTVSIATAVLYFLGQTALYIKYQKGNFLMECWGFLMLSIWTTVMTFAQP